MILHNYFCFHLIDFSTDLSYFFLLVLYLVCSCLSKALRCIIKLFIWVFFNFLVQVYINFPLRIIFIVSYRLWYFVFIFIWFCEIFHLIFDFSMFEMCCLKFTRLYICSSVSLPPYLYFHSAVIRLQEITSTFLYLSDLLCVLMYELALANILWASENNVYSVVFG